MVLTAGFVLFTLALSRRALLLHVRYLDAQWETVLVFSHRSRPGDIYEAGALLSGATW
jgi:hypothetical protein